MAFGPAPQADNKNNNPTTISVRFMGIPPVYTNPVYGLYVRGLPQNLRLTKEMRALFVYKHGLNT
jgi:hypothetical protein